MNKNDSIPVAFTCSSCKSYVKQRIMVQHKEAFKEKVKQRTVRCYACKS